MVINDGPLINERPLKAKSPHENCKMWWGHLTWRRFNVVDTDRLNKTYCLVGHLLKVAVVLK